MPTSRTTTAPTETHASSASEADSATPTAPSTKTLIFLKGRLIHLYGLNNLQQSSNFISSSDADFDSNTKTVTSRSSSYLVRGILA